MGGDENTALVCVAVKGTAHGLTMLDLSGNEITVDSMVEVVGCVGAKPKLAVLGLEDNEFGDEGALLLAQSLETNAAAAAGSAASAPPLRRLSLNTTELGSAGALAIARAFRGFDGFR